jgi:transcriptional regulator with XRE-family HTH domain
MVDRFLKKERFMTDQTLGDLLLQERKKRGLRQEDFAMILGVSIRQYQKFEKNEAIPNIKQIARLAKHYQLPIETYFETGNTEEQVRVERLYTQLPNNELKKAILQLMKEIIKYERKKTN